MRDATAKLEHLRRLCADAGIPMESLDTLAVSRRDAARLLGGLSVRLIDRFIANGELKAFGEAGWTRIELTELIDFVERKRKLPSKNPAGTARSKALSLLEGDDLS